MVQQNHHGARAGPLRDGIVAGLVVLLSSVMASGAVLYFGEGQFRAEVDMDLRRAAEMTATTIDGDLHRGFVDPAQEETTEYARAVAPLDRIRKVAEGFRYVYTVVERDGQVYFVLDPTPGGDADGDGVDDKSHVMDEYDEASPEMLEALRSGRAIVEAEPTTDQWGTFRTAYAPFFDSAGRQVGVVGLDVSADEDLVRIHKLRSAALFGVLVGALIGAGVGASVYGLQRARKRTDFALGESEARFAIVARHAPVMLWVTDADGRCVFANPAWLAFTGASAAELASRVDPPGLDDADAACWREGLLEACRRVRDWSCEVRQRRADGRECWILASAKPRRFPDGRFAGHVGFAVDLTERKQAENDLRAAKDAVEAASRAKSEFVAKVSHELRTPMNGVLGLAELLQRTRLTEEQREWVSLIASSGEVLLQLVNDVLDFARIDAGQLELSEEPFDLHELTAQVVKIMRVTAIRKSLPIERVLAPGTPRWVVGDAGRLRQVLVNLMGNAVKFTDRGSVRLVVEPAPGSPETGSADASLARVRFAVADTGVGIADEDQKRLFVAFSQVDSSAERRHGGTGLGLVIARHLVRGMGGEITLSSVPGEGSVFGFEIELRTTDDPGRASAATRPMTDSGSVADAGMEAGVRSEACASPPAALDGSLAAGVDARSTERDGVRVESSIPPPKSSLYGSGLRVLLAEDNVVNQKVAARLLRDSGFDVVVVSDGLEAVEAFGCGDFDLVLMDCQMPRMNGYEATRRIRAVPGGMRVPIVALTANAMPEDRQRCLEAGMTDYLTKPIRPALLRSALERHLGAPAADPTTTEVEGRRDRAATVDG